MKNHRNYFLSDRIFQVVNTILLILVFLIVAYPCIYIVSASFSDPTAVISGEVWLWPVRPTLRGYTAAFRNKDLVRGFLNAVLITVLGTSVNIILTVMLAYPLSRRTFYGRGLITILITITMFFSGGLIPTFLLVNSLGLYNTFWALILPAAVGINNTIICRTYFQTNIPEELYEAGQLDGCSDAGFLVRVVLPLSAPILAVLVMYYAVGHWNSYFNAMIYLSDRDKFPLQIILREILILNTIPQDSMMDVTLVEKLQGMADLLKYSTIIISSLPMLILYPFIQKHFVKGVMVGSIKG